MIPKEIEALFCLAVDSNHHASPNQTNFLKKERKLKITWKIDENYEPKKRKTHDAAYDGRRHGGRRGRSEETFGSLRVNQRA